MTKASTSVSPPVGVASQATSYIDERLLKAELAAVEARTETKFAQLMGKLELLVQSVGDLRGDVFKLDVKITTVDGHARTGKREVITAIITTGLTVAALGWAGVQIFQGGLSLSQGANQAAVAAKDTVRNDQPQASPRKR